MTVETITLEDGKYELRYENGVIRPFRNGEYWAGRGDMVDKLVASMFHRIKNLENALTSAVDFIESAPVQSGVCCCGADIATHDSAMNCGHTPVDQWDDAMRSKVVELKAVMGT